MSILGKRAIALVSAVAKTHGLEVDSVIADDNAKSVVAVKIKPEGPILNFVVRHNMTAMRPSYFAQYDGQLFDYLHVVKSAYGEFAEAVSEELRRIA